MANVLTNLDLHKNEIRNAVIQPLAVEPTTPKLGQFYFDSTTNKIKIYTGREWEEVGKSTAIGTIAWENVTNRPTKLSQFTNDKGYQTSSDVNSALGKKLSVQSGVTDTILQTAFANYETAYSIQEQINGKAQASAIPKNLSQLTNDSGFITGDNVYTKEQVNNKIAGVATPKRASEVQSQSTKTHTVIGYITNVTVVDNTTKEEVLCDLQYPNITGNNNQVTVTVSPYTNPLTVIISYL